MFHKEWEVLLVDDEPDVLSVSQLAMQDFTVYGLPLKLHMAESKAQALELLTKSPRHASAIAVAFVDVVMESDTAGLELCQYIREEMNNDLTQLYVRTGQPGIAPERDVIDRYDISGYFTKAEATEDKLYSLVKSGVRQYLSGWYSVVALTAYDGYMAVMGSRQKLEEAVQQLFGGLVVNEGESAPRDTMDVYGSLLLNGQAVASMGLDEKPALAMRDMLDQLAGQPLSADGDKYVRDEDGNQMIKIASQPSRAEICWVYRTPFVSPHSSNVVIHGPLACLATLWQTAA